MTYWNKEVTHKPGTNFYTYVMFNKHEVSSGQKIDKINNLFWFIRKNLYITKEDNNYMLNGDNVKIHYTRTDINYIIYEHDNKFYENGNLLNSYHIKNNLIIKAAGCNYKYIIPGTKYVFYGNGDIRWTYDGDYKFIDDPDVEVNHVISDKMFFEHKNHEDDWQITKLTNLTSNFMERFVCFYFDDISFVEQYFRLCLGICPVDIFFKLNNIMLANQQHQRGYGSSAMRVFFEKVEHDMINGPLILSGKVAKINEKYSLWSHPYFAKTFVALMMLAIDNNYKFSFYFPIDFFSDCDTRDLPRINKIYNPDLYDSFVAIDDTEKSKKPFVYHGVDYKDFFSMVRSYLFNNDDKISREVRKIIGAYGFSEVTFIKNLTKDSKIYTCDLINNLRIMPSRYEKKIIDVIKSFDEDEKRKFIINIHGSVNDFKFAVINVEKGRREIKYQTCESTVHINEEIFENVDYASILRFIFVDLVNRYVG